MKKDDYTSRKYIRLGWFVLLFAVAIVVLLDAQSPGKTPQRDALQCVTGVYEKMIVKGGMKTTGYELCMEDGGVYPISIIADFDLSDFEAQVKQGEVIELRLEDGEVCGIYKENGSAVLSVENAWEAMRENERVGLGLGAVFAAAGAVFLIYGYHLRGKERKNAVGDENTIF